MTYEEKQKWFWKLRLDASEEMRRPSYEDLINLFEELEKAWAALEHVQSIAGHPDASEGCRQIIKRAREALNSA